MFRSNYEGVLSGRSFSKGYAVVRDVMVSSISFGGGVEGRGAGRVLSEAFLIFTGLDSKALFSLNWVYPFKNKGMFKRLVYVAFESSLLNKKIRDKHFSMYGAFTDVAVFKDY